MLSIIIICYDRFEITKSCLDSLFLTIKDIEYEIILWDNNCKNRYCVELKNHIDTLKNKNIKLIPSEKNMGFGKAINLAVLHTRFPYLLILNNDVQIRKADTSFFNTEKLSTLNNSIGFCKIWKGTNIYNYEKWYFPGLVGQLKHGIGYCTGIKLQPDYYSASLWFIPKNLFILNGGFSERFFLYAEDADFAYRLMDFDCDFIELVGWEINHQSKKHLPIGTEGSKKHTFSNIKYLLLQTKGKFIFLKTHSSKIELLFSVFISLFFQFLNILLNKERKKNSILLKLHWRFW